MNELTKNDQIFMEALKKFDPELSMIKLYLMHTRINPQILPVVLDQLSMIDRGSGFGSVIINIFDRKVVSIRGTDDRAVDFNVTV